MAPDGTTGDPTGTRIAVDIGERSTDPYLPTVASAPRKEPQALPRRRQSVLLVSAFSLVVTSLVGCSSPRKELLLGDNARCEAGERAPLASLVGGLNGAPLPEAQVIETARSFLKDHGAGQPRNSGSPADHSPSSAGDLKRFVLRTTALLGPRHPCARPERWNRFADLWRSVL